MAGPENRIESAFVTWCREKHGIDCRKLKDAGKNFFPDRSIILPGGRIICIEFKSPDGHLSKGQERCIEELRGLGVPVLVTCDKEEAIRWLLEQM